MYEGLTFNGGAFLWLSSNISFPLSSLIIKSGMICWIDLLDSTNELPGFGFSLTISENAFLIALLSISNFLAILE